jgi:hypothetical protein
VNRSTEPIKKKLGPKGSKTKKRGRSKRFKQEMKKRKKL